MPLISIDATFAEKMRLRAERERQRKAVSRHTWSPDKRKRHDGKDLSYSEYPFVFWDGEAPKDTGYSLFGSSLGHEICHPQLSTEECFDLLLSAKAENPQSIFVMFGSRYDFDEIIRQDMPADRIGRIKWFGSTTWHGYTIKQAEGKWFEIKKNGVCVTVYETFGWFNCKFVKALEDYQIGTVRERQRLTSDKNRRSEFLYEEINDIRKYMRLELKLGVKLMERIREICLQAGFNPRAWYGPSALATQMLRRNGIKKHMAKCPEVVNNAAQYAYAAGRFEMFRGGILGPVYSADINNAYVRAMLELPSLAHGKWRRGKFFEPGKFAVYHIRYRHSKRFDHMYPMPLFRRLSNGTVCWPATVDSWYWNPEAEIVKDNPDAKFIEAWIFDEDNPSLRPFAFVKEVFRKRQILKALPVTNPSHAAELAFKWALVAIYGQLCRTVGWDKFRKRPPAFHQLEWAGFLTSWCRAEVWKVAQKCGDKLISIDTDSVSAMCPIEGVTEGNELGEWKLSQADSGVFYQSGVYFHKKDSQWVYTRLRGVDYKSDNRRKRPPVDPDLLIQAIRSGKPVRIAPKARYISLRQSLGWGLKLQGQWVKPEEFEKLIFGGQGKRYHNTARCPTTCSGDQHVFVPCNADMYSLDPHDPLKDMERILYTSKAHTLPWLGGEETDVEYVKELLWIDPSKLDSDDAWIAELVS